VDLKELTTDEWYTVLEGASAASGLIMGADVSGPIGLTKEATAALEVIREDRWQTPFMAAFRGEVLAATKGRQEEFKKIAQARQAEMKAQKPTREQAQQMGLASIRNAVALVDSKAGTEAGAEYRQVIWEASQKTAAAGKEGGFLGFGGKLVSDAEQNALSLIKDELGL
jgi:hypothetical protein